MIKQEPILNPTGRLAKVFLIPLAAAILVFISIYFLGYRGRSKPAIPVTALDYMSPFEITILIMVFLLTIYAIFFWKIEDVSNFKRITIDNKVITLENAKNRINFKLNKAKAISISVSKIWAVLYSHRFYRVGIIKFKYGSDKFIFYFPIRNQDVELEIKNIF